MEVFSSKVKTIISNSLMPALQGPEEELPWTERGSLNPSSLLRTLKVTGLRPRSGSWNYYQVRTLRFSPENY